MTNEEKVNELSIKIAQEYDGKDMVGYECAMKMVELKDNYYKKLLDLLVKSGANADIITDYIENCI